MNTARVGLAALLLSPALLLAQIATTTSLVGTVTDASAKTVVGAKVTAVNTGTLDTYTTVTNEQGYYRIEFIRTGSYKITIEQPGFQKIEKTNVEVAINQVVRNDFTLAVGTVTQSVTIEATASAIKTDDASVSELLSTRAVADLPLNGRNPLRLAVTTPGVVFGLKATNGTPPGEGFIGAGTREIQNSVSLDGISIVENLITKTPTRPMVEAVQEVEIQTGTYSAQYGSYMGVHMNVVTKSGTNAIHGNLVEFLRNDKLDARPYFLAPTADKSPLRQNQFGVEFDGPVVIPRLYSGRDRSFFMGSYEGLRQIRATAGLGTVMTPQMWGGDFSQLSSAVNDPLAGNTRFPGNVIPAGRLSPISLKLRQYIPQKNIPGPSLSSNYTAVIPNNNSTNSTVERFDHNIGSNIRLLFRYQRQAGTLLAGATNPFGNTTVTLYTHNYSVGYTHTLTPHVVNDIRFGRQFMDTQSLNYWTVNGLKDAGAQLGIPGFDGDVRYNNPGIPDFNISGYQGVNNASTNWYQDDTTWQGSEQISWTRGAHNIMAGFELRKLITGRTSLNNPRGNFNFTGTFTGNSAADFMLGFPAALTTTTIETRTWIAGWRDGFFALDNFQVSRKLTLSYGLRYELPTVPYTVNGNARELNPAQTQLVPLNPPEPGFRFIFPNHKDFAPRLGIAYRLNNKTVLRGGYGIYFNPNQTNSFTFLSGNPPFSQVLTYTSLPNTPQLSLTNPTPAGLGAAPPPNVTTDNWHLPTAYMNQWSFSVQRELWSGSGLELQYLGSHSVHLDRNYYNNTPLPGPGAINPRRPNQAFAQIRTVQNDMVATYQGLSAVLRQRMMRRLQFLASYTWAHALDVTTDSNNSGTPMDPYNWKLDYGNSNWDIRHRFVSSFVYDIPFFHSSSRVLNTAFARWQLNGIVTLQSGLPFNVSISTDRANTSSQGTQRPDLIAPPSSNCGGGHLSGCIVSTSFALPAQYTYGNAGRNLLHGPHLFTSDLSVFKNFAVSERAKLQFRAEFFNFTNSPQFSNPNGVWSASAFGSISSTTIENRDVQFGLKLAF
jgi:Carboxypeptidase regulatory-like domain/TonB dependent receptor